MKIDIMDVLYALSVALDAVEKEVTVGVKLGHGKRVGYLSYLLGKASGMQEDELREFVGCAILHDNALSEYFRKMTDEMSEDEVQNMNDFLQINKLNGVADLEENLEDTSQESVHCTIGEKRMNLLPLHTDLKTVLLYHHENADGTGPFGKTENEITLKSQILRLADQIDIVFDLEHITEEMMEEIEALVKKQEGKRFSKKTVDLFGQCIDYRALAAMQEDGCEALLRKNIPVKETEYSEEEIKGISRFFAEIVDYKSSFTKDHSMGVAELSEKMAKYYKFDLTKRVKYYFAGAMHDIGKLMVSNDILEKPGKLDKDEFAKMKHHATATYQILSQINDIEDIVGWAANHHEKLDGSGYPRGLRAEDLSFEERLMSCIDIYQALIEKRPYKDGLPQEKAFAILDENVANGQLDADIVQDMKLCLIK